MAIGHNVENVELDTISQSSEKKDGVMAWVVCCVGALFFFYEFIQLNFFNAIGSGLMHDFHLSAGQLGNLSAYYLYSNVALLFAAGVILDRFSVRRVMLVALSICVIGVFGFSVTTHLGWAKFFYLMTGIGGAFVFLSCMRLASRWFSPSRLAFATGIIVLIAMLGGYVAQWPLMHLVEKVHWRAAMRWNAGLGLCILILIFFVVRDCPQGGETEERNEQKSVGNMGLFSSLISALKQAHNWLCGLYACFINLPISLLGGVWGVPYLIYVHKLTHVQAAEVTSMLFWGTIIGAPLAGWISDKLGRRRLPMVIGAFVSIILLVFLILTPSLGLLGESAMFFSLGLLTSTQVIAYPFIADRAPKMLIATSISVASFLIMGGQGWFRSLFGNVLQWHADKAAGHLTQVYSAADFQYAMWVFPIAIVIALLCIMFTREDA